MNTPTTIAIKLNKAGERAVKQGHPWVFEQSIEKSPDEQTAPGSLCILFDQRTNKPFAFGLWDPQEIIRIKIIDLGTQLHLTSEFWLSHLKKAHALRKTLFQNNVSGYRAIHGENDNFPGLILDVYAQTGVLKIYSEIWKPYLKSLLPIILKTFNLKNIVIRFSRKMTQNNSFSYQEGAVAGAPLTSEKIAFTEYGVQFYAYVQSGHKTGFFLDQRPNRLWVQQHAQNKKVLDVFSYVGGFGIHALKGQAKSLTSIDISSQAMEVAAENVALNGLDHSSWTPLTTDAFVALHELVQQGELFDMVIIDPPSFAKQASEVTNAMKQYARLTRLGKQLVAKNGILILGSCSSRISLEDFRTVHQKAQIKESHGWHHLHTTLHDDDHPITFPESNYLKTIFYQKT